jgi:hypothetical protein
MCNEEKFFVTTFCAQPHSLNDGKPLRHECYIIPPKLLKMERDSESPAEWDECRTAWAKWREKSDRRIHRGKKR